MKKTGWLLLIFWLSFHYLRAQAPAVNAGLLNQEWPARWLSGPNQLPTAYGVYHFRRSFDLPAKPAKMLVHVSADNRYKLYLNGKPIGEGPARGSIGRWQYETLDLAPQLQAGKNVLAAVVWNFGEHKPIAQMSHKTGFILQADAEPNAFLNTDAQWKVIRNEAYQPIPYGPVAFHGYYVVGPGDNVQAQKYPWGWQEKDYDDAAWQKPVVMERGRPQNVEGHAYWQLAAREIPPLEHKPQRFAAVRRSQNVTIPKNFLTGKGAVMIPANTTATILLDQAVLTTAYPQLLVSGGQGSEVKISFAETMFDPKFKKPNRNQVEGMQMFGNHDLFYPDGGTNRLFEPLWYRTFRYVQLDVKTQAQPLTILDFTSEFTAYPFQLQAQFKSDDPSLQNIWQVGWRTARLCANELYMDCPYYEQLQYLGDTRIQSLISLYNSGDDRLMRQAITHLNDSRVPSGLTQSRYPSDLPQFIPNFSLIWVTMLHDYWQHRPDEAFVKQYIQGIEGVFDWFEKYINEEQMLNPMPFWEVIDHPYQEKQIMAKGGTSKSRTGSTLMYVYSLQRGAELLRHFGRACEADRYDQLAATLQKSMREKAFDTKRQLLADTPDKLSFSQHANIMAVLTNTIPVDQQKAVMQKVLQDKDLIQASTYFQFYLFQALQQTGQGDLYIANLQPWRNMLADGLTTFAEWEVQPRSDCHAWSASPNYDLFATVCGIRPASPGFKTVSIKPALGTLKEVEARIPHPQGNLQVKLKRKGTQGLEGEVNLPGQVSGELVWNGQKMSLKPGRQKINLKDEVQ